MVNYRWGKHSKRLTALIMTLVLLFGSGFTAATTFAENADVGQEAQFNDIENHWAREQILGWSQKGLIAGYEDGTFRPEKEVIRAEFTAFVNRAYGLTQKAQVAFTDVSPQDWFSDEIAKAVAAGYIGGYSDGTMRPAAGISRQEAAVILYKLLMLSSIEDESRMEGLSDAGSIATWAREYINAAIAGEYLSGYPDGTFKPDRVITRAETVALLSKAVGRLYNAPGTYGPEEGSETVVGNVTVNTADVILQNLVIEGDLFLTAGIGDGDFEADGVVVKGRTIVSGGGEESVVFNNTSLEEVIVYVVDGKVRVVARGDTEIEKILMESGGRLQEDGLTGDGFRDVQILVLKPGETIELDGDFDKVSVETTVDVNVTGSTRIGELIVSEEAEGTTIDTGDDTVIDNLTLNGDTEITGQGSIETAYVNTDNYDFETDPDKLIVDGKEEKKSSGGGGGGGTRRVAVSAISVDKEELTLPVGETGQITAIVLPTNATNKNITWTSSDESVATVTNGVVTPVTMGAVTITATTVDGGKTATISVTVVPEGTVAMIGTTTYSSLKDALDVVAEGDTVIELIGDARLEYGARDAYGNESTQKVTIKGNGKDLTLHQTNTDWSSIGLTGADAIFALENVNVVKTTVDGGNGAWNNHAINFSSKIELTNTTFDNAINLSADAKLIGVTITEAGEYYGIWIGANGQTVTIEDTTVTANTNGGRGIKISDQYIESPQLVKLSVSNSTFNTAKKSAIIVGSAAGAEITIDKLNIENVQADKINAVWVDEGWADYQDLVTVTGGTKTLEGAVARIGDTGYLSLQAAIAAALADDVIEVAAGEYEVNTKIYINKNLTITGEEGVTFKSTGTNSILETSNGAKLTISGVDFIGTKAANQVGIEMEPNTEVEASDSTFTNLNSGIYVNTGAILTVTGSTFTDVNAGVGTDTAAEDLSISGNDFTGLDEAVGFTAPRDTEANFLALKADIIINNTGATEGNVTAYGTFMGDLTEYNELLAAIVEEDYTTASWEAYQAIVEENEVTGASSQLEIDIAIVNIKYAQKYLILATVKNTSQELYYASIQEAIDGVVVGENLIKVYPGNHGTDSIEIIQQEGVDITLEAVGEVVLKNQIRIDGQNRYTGDESLTIKGFTFDFTDATGAVDIISAVKNEIESTNNYAHNITIENNVFKGNPSVDVVAIRTNGAFGLEINSSEGIGLHSFGQIQGQSDYFRVIDTTVTGGESGFNYYGAADIEITGLTVEGTGYGVRAGQSSGPVTTVKLTISDSNLNAENPVWLRVNAPGTVEITDSVLEPTGDGPMITDDTNGAVDITIDGEPYSVPE